MCLGRSSWHLISKEFSICAFANQPTNYERTHLVLVPHDTIFFFIVLCVCNTVECALWVKNWKKVYHKSDHWLDVTGIKDMGLVFLVGQLEKVFWLILCQIDTYRKIAFFHIHNPLCAVCVCNDLEGRTLALDLQPCNIMQIYILAFVM